MHNGNLNEHYVGTAPADCIVRPVQRAVTDLQPGKPGMDHRQGQEMFLLAPSSQIGYGARVKFLSLI